MSDGEASAGKAEGPGKIDEQYIQSEIDKLNIEELVQPEQNNALKRVIKTDRKIVTHLDSRISALHKSCQKEQTKKHSRTKQTLGNTTYRKLKEFSHESEPEIKLETYEQSMRLKDKLGQLEKKKKNIPFLNFIVDCNPTNGFNETTFRLFLVTLLVSKGHVEFYRDANKVLCVRTSDLFRHTEQGGSGGDGSGEDGGVGNGSAGDGSGGGGYSARRTGETLPPRKNQALLTAWSYQKWEELVNRLAPHR
ncbi:hypothetical protein PVIIG_04785 [Plasmodium vivax India VII]|uniref:Non-structural maintenance of chromosomes element 4 n=1 Tax=Plasmodium vivax India VII TaxID=1077284 RepID=A0A0J9SBC7_PLAVI|nr:hypothetical protein PVIIG_04785 [Plasmodium vivax India VII]